MLLLPPLFIAWLNSPPNQSISSKSSFAAPSFFYFFISPFNYVINAINKISWMFEYNVSSYPLSFHLFVYIYILNIFI